MSDARKHNSLTKLGARMTKGRREIIALLEHAHTPLSVGDITRQVHANETSVYRTLTLLKEKGYVHEFHYPDGVHRYELTHAHHDHVICTSCGFTEHVPCVLNGKKPRTTKNFSKLTSHEATYYGLCERCG